MKINPNDANSLTKLVNHKIRGQIGAVCVHWGLLELAVERVIANLRGDPGIVTYEEDVGHRLDTLKALAKEKLAPDVAAEISEIAGEIKNVGHERHRVVHCLWAMDKDGEVISVFARSKIDDPSKPMDAEAVRQVKLRIWRVIKRLMKFVGPEKRAVLPSRRRSKKPNRPRRNPQKAPKPQTP